MANKRKTANHPRHLLLFFNQAREGIRKIGVMFFLASLTLPQAALANICDDAARIAARNSGVPIEILYAVSRTETGRHQNGDFQPWPWTVNMQGKGRWFGDQESALEYVMDHHRNGTRNFDVGCFQVNFRWHNSAFNSLAEMFDPKMNATYAAKFLHQLFEELGEWEAAVGAYHSRTRVNANRYLSRYRKILAALPEIETDFPLLASRPPLLTTGKYKDNANHDRQDQPKSILGSLVPMTQRHQPLITTAKSNLVDADS